MYEVAISYPPPKASVKETSTALLKTALRGSNQSLQLTGALYACQVLCELHYGLRV